MILKTTRGQWIGLLLFTLLSLGLLAYLVGSFGGPDPLGRRPGTRPASVVVADANGIASQADVLVRGVKVGRVARVEAAGDRTRLVLALQPERLPGGLRRGATVRVGTKTALGEPFADLDPGPRTAPALGTDPVLRARDSVEVDEALSVLDPGARRHLVALARTAARAGADPQAPQEIGQTLAGLERATQALDDTAGALRGQEGQITAAVRGTGTVLRAVAQEDGAVRRVVGSARTTLRATASQPAGLRGGLEELPRLLGQTQRTLDDARPLVAEARPVATGLTAAAPGLTRSLRALPPALGDLDDVLDGAAGLRRAAAPALRTLDRTLPVAAEAAQRLSPALANAVPMLRYVAERRETVAAWFSNTADLGVNGDAKGRWARFFIGFDPGTALAAPGAPDGNSYSTAGDARHPRTFQSGDFPRLLPLGAALQRP